MEQENNHDVAETAQDVDYALSVLADISEIQTGLGEATVTLNAGAVRNCLELMLSLLEAHEGFDVTGAETFLAMQKNSCFTQSLSKH